MEVVKTSTPGVKPSLARRMSTVGESVRWTGGGSPCCCSGTWSDRRPDVPLPASHHGCDAHNDGNSQPSTTADLALQDGSSRFLPAPHSDQLGSGALRARFSRAPTAASPPIDAGAVRTPPPRHRRGLNRSDPSKRPPADHRCAHDQLCRTMPYANYNWELSSTCRCSHRLPRAQTAVRGGPPLAARGLRPRL